MNALRAALVGAACVLAPAFAVAALVAYVYDRVVARQAELFAGIDDEVASWGNAGTVR